MFGETMATGGYDFNSQFVDLGIFVAKNVSFSYCQHLIILWNNCKVIYSNYNVIEWNANFLYVFYPLIEHILGKAKYVKVIAHQFCENREDMGPIKTLLT